MTHQETTTPVRREAAGAVGLVATLGIAAGCWVIAVRQMPGMDMGSHMGPATELGPLGAFLGLWTAMMAAMMLPGALPAVLRCARLRWRVQDGLLFAASYLTVWTVVGLAVYGVDRPHGTSVAGGLAIAAGIYELTPLKRACRRRCQAISRSGFAFGFACLGSSVGLMLVLVAVGVMSIIWMSAIAAVVLAQKLLPPRALVDLPLALGILAFGMLIVLAPGFVPGLAG
jgi:predicted metal-binding membrane protein